MGHTLSEKILAAHIVGEQASLRPGDLIEVGVDLILANDITAPIAIREFSRLGVEKIFDPEKVVLVADHFAPNKDISSAEQCLIMSRFANAQNISHHYAVGKMGIEHVLLPEQGLVVPGDLVVGADSHTCTYGALGAFATGVGSTDVAVGMASGCAWLRVPESMRIIYRGQMRPWVTSKDLILHTIGKIGVDGARYRAIEFVGPVVDGLSMAGRFTMANMAIEAGAKAGLFRSDTTTRAYLAQRTNRSYPVYHADPDAEYSSTVEIDVGRIEPQVAFPHIPENVRAARDAGDVKIDQVVIGSCTNGRLEDLCIAADVFRGRKVHSDVRCIIIPGSQEVYLSALRRGFIETFITAGAAVSTPTCGPCLGGHMGVLASGERAVSTTNRNFRGRMGDPASEVYLAGVPVAAASAIAGRIAVPEEVTR
jgi:3-isopropylmalate/(R)-2-methylmalate dehydratase large subunit